MHVEKLREKTEQTFTITDLRVWIWDLPRTRKNQNTYLGSKILFLYKI